MCEKLPQWLAPDSDLWRGAGQSGGFEQIHRATKKSPAYPHDNHLCSLNLDTRLKPLMVHHLVTCMRESFGLLRDAGLGVDEVNWLIEAMIEELKDPERCSLLKLYAVHARKRG